MVKYKYLTCGEKIVLTKKQNRDYEMPNGVNGFEAGDTGIITATLGFYLCNVKMSDGTIITVPTSEVEYAKTDEV